MKLIYEAKVSIEIDLAKAGVTNEEVEEKIKEVGLSGLKKHIECSLVETFCPTLPEGVEGFSVTTTLLDIQE